MITKDDVFLYRNQTTSYIDNSLSVKVTFGNSNMRTPYMDYRRIVSVFSLKIERINWAYITNTLFKEKK